MTVGSGTLKPTTIRFWVVAVVVVVVAVIVGLAKRQSALRLGEEPGGICVKEKIIMSVTRALHVYVADDRDSDLVTTPGVGHHLGALPAEIRIWSDSHSENMMDAARVGLRKVLNQLDQGCKLLSSGEAVAVGLRAVSCSLG
jgi:hypothetical protein